ncbi:MAG: transferase [Chlorogloeopsis fritschii C42_A2020_084]|uniref:transferase n=1 Tax=Chlorogloeopsis fritschii TaxID=1124 RepID=UPI001A0585B4|nr:transferase [Chlorogloeopsis fritschii]MBF2007585.1 transferase [Chlorogloeopsis fritschii C42_A2020_084]
MSVPPLRLSHNFDAYISGEVIIHPSAVLAPGVILQAAPNSKIIIGSGVCIGMGSILKVHEGTLEVETGANLGAGFLMVGKGKIGANACIGSATTIFNCSVEPGQVVAPGSVLGDTSRQISDLTTATDTTQPSTSSQSNSTSTTTASDETDVGNLANGKENSPKPAINTPNPDLIAQQPEPQNQHKQEPSTESTAIGTHIYGQGSIQQLLITLFPHRQSLNKPNSDDSSE